MRGYEKPAVPIHEYRVTTGIMYYLLRLFKPYFYQQTRSVFYMPQT